MKRRQDDEPVLITEAAVSFEDEFAARKKRYSLIMACRIPCLLLAGVFGIGFNWPWVAVAFIVLSVPLPWVAVLIANDRPPKKSQKVNRYRSDRTALPAVSEARIIEAAEVLDARSHRTDGPRQSQQDGPDHAPPRTGTGG
ncbi:DUF3099 domain-containing protein [Actinomycetospora chiangmaiensis]|uniref:DUF3099 domain-containing protein n=1 Tax=Actinomycetospora chiangmaiensis TaxID=402650 RepID=UPI00036241BB|nr:DUF3099 domain-containing protein [Actinomycetospora chiangmaiensis]